MSELQLDDPEPFPNAREYSENYQTGQTYDMHGLSAELLGQEILSRDEREDIVSLSNEASEILERYGHGENTRRRAEVPGAQLTRVILDGAWIFTFEDTLEERRRCRSWRLGGDGVSWCDDEWRYEEATAVHERLITLFPMDNVEADDNDKVSKPFEKVVIKAARIKVELARAIFR